MIALVEHMALIFSRKVFQPAQQFLNRGVVPARHQVHYYRLTGQDLPAGQGDLSFAAAKCQQFVLVMKDHTGYQDVTTIMSLGPAIFNSHRLTAVRMIRYQVGL